MLKSKAVFMRYEKLNETAQDFAKRKGAFFFDREDRISAYCGILFPEKDLCR